jgi:hypothetical protein
LIAAAGCAPQLQRWIQLADVHCKSGKTKNRKIQEFGSSLKAASSGFFN